MTPMVKKLLMDKKPIIPQNLKPYCLAWWDARERGQVWYGLNQLVANGDFHNGTTGWIGNGAALTDSSNAINVIGNGTSPNPSTDLITSIPYVVGKKYYVRYKGMVTNSNCSFIDARFYITGGLTQIAAAQNSPSINTVYTKSAIITIPATSTGNIRLQIVHTYADAATANGKVMEVQQVLVYDLTAIFGAGNEPTAAEMDAILAADGSQYWEGTRQVLCNPDFKYYWRDMSGNNRHMKLNNFAYSGASGWQIPYGLQCDAVDDYGRYVAAEINPVNSNMSIYAIFKIPNIFTLHYICMTSDSVPGASFTMHVSNSDLIINTNDSASGNSNITTTIEANKIYHGVISYDQITKKTTLYLNGNKIAESSALTNGLKQITRIKTGISSLESSYTKEIVYAMAAFPQKALNAFEVRRLYESNKRRFIA